MNIKEKLHLFIESNLAEYRLSRESRFKALRSEKNANYNVHYESRECCTFGTNFDEYAKNNKTENKFQKLLFEFIDQKGLKDSDVYNKVHIDRRLFSKIRNEDYHPSKETVLLLAFSLELSENEMDDLLQSASYSLPKNNTYDLIIRFCFIEKIYNIFDVNELLSTYNCKVFE